MPIKKPGTTNASSMNQEQTEIQNKLQSLNEEIAKIHIKRKQLSPLAKYSVVSNAPEQPGSPPKDLKDSVTKKSHARKFHHPHLDFVIATTASSPYLTSPEKNYTTSTIQLANKIRYLKFLGKKAKDIDAKELGCDLTKSREIFMKEVVEFKAHFEYHDKVRNMPLQYDENQPAVVVRDVHDKPHRESLVFPNKYEPLSGHTGKLKHVESFLYEDFDPTQSSQQPLRPWTSPEHVPPGLNPMEYQSYINELAKEAKPRKQLNHRRPTTLHRQASGTLRAHMGRGGPKKYKRGMEARKVYKEYVRQASRAQTANDVSTTHDHDETAAYFQDDPYDMQDHEEQEQSQLPDQPSHATIPIASLSIDNEPPSSPDLTIVGSPAKLHEASSSDNLNMSPESVSKQQSHPNQPYTSTQPNWNNNNNNHTNNGHSTDNAEDEFIYEDDDDFESFTSQKILENDDSLMGEQLISPNENDALSDED